MTWVNALGIYLVAGSVAYGLGWVARTAWTEAGRCEPIRGKWERLGVWIGTAIGVLFWPLVLGAILVGWRVRRRTRRMERLLGFCEHATAWEPYCGQCRRDLKREEAERTSSVSIRTYIEIEADMDRRCREVVAAYLKTHSACPGCGRTGTLGQYLESVWVKCSGCGRRIFTPDPSMPEEVDTVPGWPAAETVMAEARSCYDCSDCGATYEGVPAGARADGRPLCVGCQIART
jgi:hypothetical protein